MKTPDLLALLLTLCVGTMGLWGAALVFGGTAALNIALFTAAGVAGECIQRRLTRKGGD